MSQFQPSHPAPRGSPRAGGNAKIALLASLVLIALPVLAYCVLLASTAVDVPYLDDYDVVLRFLLEAGEPDGEPLRLLFAQHVEHRLVLVRAIALTMVSATGHVDFSALAWIGTLGLALLATGLFVAFRPTASLGAKCLVFAPVVLFLFQPQSWDAFFWATSSLSNLWVLPLALATLLLLSRQGPRAMAGAVLLAAVAVVAQGNGLLVLPGGLVLLGMQHRWRAAAFWAAASLLIGGLYALDFRPVDGAPSLLDSLQRAPTLIHYALNFLGSAAGFSHPLLSPLFGGLMLCSVAALWRVGFPKQNPVLYSLLLLLVASAGLNALGRWYISGAEYPLTAVRYRFYSSSMLALTYLCWAQWVTARIGEAERGSRLAGLSRVFLSLTLVGALVFSTASYARYAWKAVETSNQLRGGLQHWWSTGRGLRHHDVRHAGSILTRAIERGLYVPEQSERPDRSEPPRSNREQP